MKTKYFYIVSAAFAIAITAVAGFKHFMPSAVSENTTLSALSGTSNTVISTAETSAVKLLKAMKRDGIIKLYLFEKELSDPEKMESIYLLNKFPELSEIEILSEKSIYVKL